MAMRADPRILSLAAALAVLGGCGSSGTEATTSTAPTTANTQSDLPPIHARGLDAPLETRDPKT